VAWQEENNKSSEYMDWTRGLYHSMTPFVSWGPRAAYINYMDFDLGVMDLVNTNVPSEVDSVDTARLWGEKYFLKNYDRLVRAKTLIDPNNVFNNEQGIPPMSPTSFTTEKKKIVSS
jgi:FAD/FMN-containing dehydrogenase